MENKEENINKEELEKIRFSQLPWYIKIVILFAGLLIFIMVKELIVGGLV